MLPHPSAHKQFTPLCGGQADPVHTAKVVRPWRDLPERFGKWSGVYCRWRRWTATGLWGQLLSALAQGARGTTRFVDSTHVKLHQDGANPANGQSERAIGRTKGGLNNKIAAVVEIHGRAVAVSLHPGPRSDVRTMDGHVCLLRGRTLVADKGFDADGLRTRVAYFGGRTCIPPPKELPRLPPVFPAALSSLSSGRKLLPPDQAPSPAQHSSRQTRLHLLRLRSTHCSPRLAQQLILQTRPTTPPRPTTPKISVTATTASASPLASRAPSEANSSRPRLLTLRERPDYQPILQPHSHLPRSLVASATSSLP